jgi:hypothetical protein
MGPAIEDIRMNALVLHDQIAAAKALRAKFYGSQSAMRPVVIPRALPPVPAPDPVVQPPIEIDPNEAEWEKRKAEADAVVGNARGRISTKFLIAAFAAENGVTFNDLTGRSREQRISHLRQDCWAEIKRLRPDISLPSLGKLFDGRDHTTVLHGINASNKRAGR